MKFLLSIAVLAASTGGAYGSVAKAEVAVKPLVVHIRDFKFAPTPINVRVGDTVAFVNDDAEAHTVTASDKKFDSEGLDSNGTWKHTFATAGTFAYFCELHPYMKGTIVVVPAEKK